MGARPQHSPAYRRMCRQLRLWREQAGQTQRELASHLGKPHSYVHKVEAGDRRIDPIEFIAWCRATGVDPREGIGVIAGE